MYPSFNSHNLKLRPVSVTSTSPVIRRNIAFLPFTNLDVSSEANSFTSETTTLSSQVSLSNGKLTLHPFSSNWYSQNVSAKPQLNEDNQYKNWTELKQAAHGTQWADWDQYIGGVETEDQTIPLQNATLSQKTGSMVNNKNNIEMIIGDRKVNTTLKYYSEAIRIGFVFESLDVSPNNTETYQVHIKDFTPSTQDGMRLTFAFSGAGTVDKFISNFLGKNISQAVGAQTAVGIIQHILPTANTNEFYLYITNIDSTLFTVGTISGLNGSVTAVQNFSNYQVDDQGILCGDFSIAEKQFSINSSVEVRVCSIDNSYKVKKVEGSTKFHIGGLIENMSSHTNSIRPVRKKLFSDDHTSLVPYVEDRTYKTLGTVPIPVFLHQPFVFEESLFLSQIDLKVLNTNAAAQRFILTIQPMIQETLSPSLVLPFSEQVVSVDASYNNTLSIKFDVPVFITGNKEYAIVLRSNSSDLSFRTSEIQNTVFYTDCFVKASSGIPTQESKKKLQVYFHRADFSSDQKELQMKFIDSTPYYADQSRLNVSSFELLNTKCEYRWKARNFDSNLADTHETPIVSNKTKVHEKRKIFDSTYEMNVIMNSSDPKFTPMIDLDRTSVVAVEHLINNGGLKSSLLSGSGTRIGIFTDNLRVIMKEPNLKTEASFEFDVNGNVSNLTSDSNFLVHGSTIEFEVQKWNTAGYYDPAETTNDTLTVSQPDPVNSPDTYRIEGTGYIIQELTITNEFDSKKTGNPDYRYYSPIITLADDFEAKQLYVQMDTILRRSGEVFVYYRELESSYQLDEIKKKRFQIMDSKTTSANKYSNNDRSRTLEFETSRPESRFKYFQIKVCFTTTKFVEVPIVENIRILALDN